MDLTARINKVFPVDTLLRKFVTAEISSYEEPIRKGRPRGELIGLRREKFVAAILYGTTNLPLKEISELADVPYGSLRNWTSEDEQFLNVANGEQGSFSVFTVEYLRRRIEEIRKVRDEGGDVYGEIGRESVFDDARFYREETFRQICWLYFHGYTSASTLIACPRDIFKQVVRIIFAAQIIDARHIAERVFLDRVNEFIRLNKKQLRGKTPDPDFKLLISLYVDGEYEYHQGEK
jgi:hypothetical protein